MATRGRIGMELKDGSVVSIYSHWDNYPEHNGRILVSDYTTPESVKELIDGGSISSLKTEQLWESKAVRTEDGNILRDENDNWVYAPLRTPQPLYHAERGDEISVQHTNFKDFISGDSGEEYAYLYTLNNTWKCYQIGWGDTNTTEVEIPQ